MITAETWNALRAVVSRINDIRDLRQFGKFWDAILQVAASGNGQTQGNAVEVRRSLDALLKYLEAGMPQEMADSTRASIRGTSEGKLSLAPTLGDIEDPSTPLGFYSLLDRRWNDNSDSFHVRIPQTLSLLETTLQGAGMVTASIRSVNPATPKAKIDEACRTAKRIQEAVGRTTIGSLLRMTCFAVDDVFLRMPFLALEGPEDFYRDGCRFYGQGELDYYKCGVTSGFVIPEDYYGQRLYAKHGPGITREAELRPGRFGLDSIPTHPAWEEIVEGLWSPDQGVYDPQLDHPFRPWYFDSAIERIASRGGRFHNLVDVERTGLRLRERAAYWDKRGLLSPYLRDAASILAHFLCASEVHTYFVQSLDSAWRAELADSEGLGHVFVRAPTAAPFVASLLSDRVCVYTSRGPLRSINRGFWVNASVLEFLQASSRRGWELIPFYLLGFPHASLQDLLTARGERRTYWLADYIQLPTRALFRDANLVDVPPRIRATRQVETLASRIVEELLRPDLRRILRPECRPFLTLSDLPGVFGRSYGRLRHWIADYNLGAYSDQGREHRFTRSALHAFVRHELAGKRGFNDERVKEIDDAIERAFSFVGESRRTGNAD